MRIYYYNGKAYRKSTSRNVYNYAVYYPAFDHLAFYSADGKNSQHELERIEKSIAYDKENGKYAEWDRMHEGGKVVRITYIEK